MHKKVALTFVHAESMVFQFRSRNQLNTQAGKQHQIATKNSIIRYFRAFSEKVYNNSVSIKPTNQPHPQTPCEKLLIFNQIISGNEIYSCFIHVKSGDAFPKDYTAPVSCDSAAVDWRARGRIYREN